MKYCIITLFLLGLADFAAAQTPPSYARQVRPILTKYCAECHNARKDEAGLNLDTFKTMMLGAERGPILSAGKPDESKLVLLTEGKEKPTMPPVKVKLRPSKEEIAVLRAWVAAGAKDDSDLVKTKIPGIKPRVPAVGPVAAVAFAARPVDSSEVFFARQNSLATLMTSSDKKGGVMRFSAGQISALTWQRPGDWLAIAIASPGKSGSVLLYSAGDGVYLSAHPVVEHKDAILDMAFHPQGKILATASYDTQIKLIDIQAKEELRTLKEHSDAVHGVAFNPDGAQLASCSADRAVKVWDVAQGKLLYTLGEATDWLYTVAWSSDGKLIASGGVDKSIRVYQPQGDKAKLLHSVFAHEGPVLKVLFSPDSKILYSLGQDGVLKAWDAERMVERKVYSPIPGSPLCMALSPQGEHIAVGRYDGVLQILDAASGKTLREVQPHLEKPKKDDPKPAPDQPKEKKAAPPELLKVFPTAWQRGEMIEAYLEGKNLDGLTDVIIGHPGAKAILPKGPTGKERLAVSLYFPEDTPAGVYPISVRSAGGTSKTISFEVYPFHKVLAPDVLSGFDSPRTGTTIKLPASIGGRMIKAGDNDFFRFEVKAGQQIGVQVLSAALGSKLEPYLQLTDLDGKVLAESESGLLGFTFEKGGSYALGIRDRELRGEDKGFQYRMNVGPLPIVTSVFPLGLQRGTAANIEVRGVFLEQTSVKVQAAADAAPGSKVALPVTSKLGKPLGKLDVVVGEWADGVWPRKGAPDQAARMAQPGTANSFVQHPAGDLYRIEAVKGKRLVLEVEARRLGSPLDSVLEVLDEKMKPVARAVLRCQARTFVTFRDHDSVQPNIRIEAWSELGVNDYIYVGNELLRIKELPTHPDADCNFFSADGRRAGFLDTTPTHQALNEPMYKVTIHPPGAAFPPNGFPVFTLPYRNDDGGPGYGRDSRLFFDPPADGPYHIRISDARGLMGPEFVYRLTVRPPRPAFNVRFSPTNPAVGRGASIPITVTADRLDGYDGPIQLKLANLPPGFSAPATDIEAGQTSTTFALFAEAKAVESKQPLPLKLMAEATSDGQKIVREAMGEAPKVIDPGEIVCTTLESEVAFKAGQIGTLTVAIERRQNFQGRIPVEVRGLPHGVRVLDIGLNGILITEKETRRTIQIYAEPWVQATNHPIVVLAKREGKNSEHGAKSVLLKIER